MSEILAIQFAKTFSNSKHILSRGSSGNLNSQDDIIKIAKDLFTISCFEPLSTLS